MGGIKNFRDLEIWKKGMELTFRVYDVTAKFPKNEQYGLSSQLKRAATSVPSNISEGYRRIHPKESLQDRH